MLAIILAQVLTPQMPSIDIYKRAVAAMHTIKAPAYIQYDMSVRTTLPDAIVVQHVKLIERTNAHEVVAHIVDENIHDRAKPFQIAADLFLGHADESAPVNPGALGSGLDDLSDKPLKVIGSVSVMQVHYNVSTAGTDDVPNCSSAIHLKLEPLQYPLVYNLRDVWVEPATSRICKAIAVWAGQVNRKKVLARITLNLNRNGFISQYTTSASARFLTGVVTVQQEGSYENFQSVEKSAWSASTGEQKANDVKH